MRRNVVLIGFMGTGKTSMGRELSARLGCPFVDLDHRIEEISGMKIPEIFARHGEERFREWESRAVREASERHGIVISTGGGTVKRKENMAMLRERGIVICLTADVDTILLRTEHRGSRPVLDGADRGDRRRAIESLLEERRGLYDDADYTVDTSDSSPFQVVEDICRYLRKGGSLHG